MKSFAVIGCGGFGFSLATTLFELGNEVIAIDSNEEIINEISNHVTYAAVADIGDKNALRSLGVANVDVAIIGVGSLEASIIGVMLIKEFGVKTIIAKSKSKLHTEILKKVGATQVVFPEQDMGVRLAHNISRSNVLDFLELSGRFSVIEVSAVNEWFNKSLAELKLRNKYSVNVIAIKRKDNLIVTPLADQKILEGDTIIIIGLTDNLMKLETLI